MKDMETKEFFFRAWCYILEMFHDSRIRMLYLTSAHSKKIALRYYWSINFKGRVNMFRIGGRLAPGIDNPEEEYPSQAMDTEYLGYRRAALRIIESRLRWLTGSTSVIRFWVEASSTLHHLAKVLVVKTDVDVKR